MSRSTELYLKSCLARHYFKEGFTIEQINRELRKASNGFRYDKIKPNENKENFNFLSLLKKIPRNPHSLSQLRDTCWFVLGTKYNLKENHNWGWVENFCLSRDGKDKEDWYELIYEPDDKIAWSRTQHGALINNETHFIKYFAKDFLENVLPF